MSGAVRKRFWDAAQIAEAAGGGYIVELDRTPLRLPGGALLTLASRKLAQAVAQEWDLAGGGKGGVFGPDDLALTSLVGTMQEHVLPAISLYADRLSWSANNDLLCYRASHPQALLERQEQEWQPWLDWLAARHGIRLNVTKGVMPLAQPEKSLHDLRALIAGLDAGALTGLGVLAPALGSLVLGLALVQRALEADAAFRLARLDESFQEANWGADAEAQQRAVSLWREIAIAARFVELADG